MYRDVTRRAEPSGGARAAPQQRRLRAP
jgi:hypothetical protein